MIGRRREQRRFWERAEHLRQQVGMSLKLAARLVRENDRRARDAARDKTPPAELLREIRAEVRKAVHDVRRAVRP